MNLLEFNEKYNKLLKKVQTEDLRTIEVFITRTSGELLFGLMKDKEEVISYFKVI